MADPRSVLGELDGERSLIMGILNTTPDSFSDGGKWGTVDRAVQQAERMLADGADIIDIGGESSRPGADPVDVTEELGRVIPVIDALAGRCVMSIDTAKPDVAEAAVAHGAHIVNDITASLEGVAGSAGAGWIAMHMQGEPRTMQHDPSYSDVVGEVEDYLAAAIRRGRDAGIEHVWVDPGIGFGKTFEHNLLLLQSVTRLANLGAGLLVGVSRKRFIGEIHAHSDRTPGEQISPDDRLEGSIVGAVWSLARGARMVRVHDVRATALARRYLDIATH